jgi:phage shock protein C
MRDAFTEPMMRPAAPNARKGGPFGVCAAIGADFGFNPDILRVLLAAGLLWRPLVVLSAYGFAALLMLAGRLLFPVRKTPARAVTLPPEMVAQPIEEERLAA